MFDVERKCFWRSTDRVHIVPSQETEMKDMLGIVSSSEMLNVWSYFYFNRIELMADTRLSLLLKL